METQQYFVYVLRNPQGRLYIGFTTDLQRRLQQHQNGETGWTKRYRPWELVYHEVYSNRSEAIKRERSLKQGKRNQELRQFLKPTLEW
ncbi:MAG: GIY-YIG nuclease family protein [Dehalococcoidia bacterium]|nr:MAG: GIY-YIG nuclease family protein [Dehalococcoidia bacterium]